MGLVLILAASGVKMYAPLSSKHAVNEGSLTSAIASASTTSGSSLASSTVAVTESIETVAVSTSNQGVTNFEDTPSPTSVPTNPQPTAPSVSPSFFPTIFPTTCTSTPDPTYRPTPAPSAVPSHVPTPVPTGSFLRHVSPAYGTAVTLDRSFDIVWEAYGAARDCDVMLAVYANDTDTVVTVTSSHDVTYDGSEGTLAWTPDSTNYGVFQDMYSWMRISCVDGSFLAVSSPFVISMTAAPTQVPSQVPSPVPSQVPLPAPSALPTPFPTTAVPTQMPTLYPTPAPSFSPTPYATTLIVPQQLIIEATKPHVASADIFLVNLERNDQQFSIEKNFDAIDQVHALGVRLGVDHGPADAFLLPPSGTTLKLSKQRVRVNVNTTGIPSGEYFLSLDITTSSSTVNDANGEVVVRSTVTNVPIKLTVIAVAYWNTTSTEIIDGPTLGQTWDGIRVTARDRDGYPIVNDVTGAGQVRSPRALHSVAFHSHALHR